MTDNNKSYFGGKSGAGVYQTIINQIPKCSIYVEPMVGGGGVLRNLHLPETIVINDIDTAVIDNFNFNGQLQDMDIKVYNEDYKSVCLKYDGFDTVIYFDPPYHFETRKCKRKIYISEWDDQMHKDFLMFVTKLKSKIIVSHYPFRVYDEFLSDWRTITFTAQTRKGKVIERIYMNFDEPKVLQDYRYIGKDFTDRQRIKRQNSRIIKKIASLPVHQRTLLLKQINELKYR